LNDRLGYRCRLRGDETRTQSGRALLVAETLYLSSVTLAELLFGIGALPDGRRKKALTETLDGVLELFGDRVLPFDTGAAQQYANLAVKARAAGKGFPTPDGYIAAIAAS